MKLDAMTLGAVGFAAFAAWFTLKQQTPKTAAQTAADMAFGQARNQRNEVGAATWQNTFSVNEIFDSKGLPFQNDWRYYTDGTSISPEGKYYKDGALVWSPAA